MRSPLGEDLIIDGDGNDERLLDVLRPYRAARFERYHEAVHERDQEDTVVKLHVCVDRIVVLGKTLNSKPRARTVPNQE